MYCSLICSRCCGCICCGVFERLRAQGEPVSPCSLSLMTRRISQFWSQAYTTSITLRVRFEAAIYNSIDICLTGLDSHNRKLDQNYACALAKMVMAQHSRVKVYEINMKHHIHTYIHTLHEM